MKQHFLNLLFLPALMRIHARIKDEDNTKKTNTNMDSIDSIISQAERGNRSLTDYEAEMISNDYENKCQCHCNVHVGDIINEVASNDYRLYRRGTVSTTKIRQHDYVMVGTTSTLLNK